MRSGGPAISAWSTRMSVWALGIDELKSSYALRYVTYTELPTIFTATYVMYEPHYKGLHAKVFFTFTHVSFCGRPPSVRLLTVVYVCCHIRRSPGANSTFRLNCWYTHEGWSFGLSMWFLVLWCIWRCFSLFHCLSGVRLVSMKNIVFWSSIWGFFCISLIDWHCCLHQLNSLFSQYPTNVPVHKVPTHLTPAPTPCAFHSPWFCLLCQPFYLHICLD